MTEHRFFDYVIKFGAFQKRSMFGGTGLFKDEAMFVLIVDKRIYIRGCQELDDDLLALGCDKYRHVKKQTTATVNYYDVTDLFMQDYPRLDEMLYTSIKHSVAERHSQKSLGNRWIRDLCVFRSIPNSHFGMTRTPISV